MIWCLKYWRESFWNTFSQITLIQLELNSFMRAAGLCVNLSLPWICLQWILFELHGSLSRKEHSCPSMSFSIIKGTCNLLCVSVMRGSEMALACSLGRNSTKWSAESSGVTFSGESYEGHDHWKWAKSECNALFMSNTYLLNQNWNTLLLVCPSDLVLGASLAHMNIACPL